MNNRVFPLGKDAEETWQAAFDTVLQEAPPGYTYTRKNLEKVIDFLYRVDTNILLIVY